MTAAICPYCRGRIGPGDENLVLCRGCETPHHADCYQENGGCTVFGCSLAPADEPKLRLSAPEIASAGGSAAAVAVAPAESPASLPTVTDPIITTFTDVLPVEEARKSKMTFVILGVLLGTLGVHNFYAGYLIKAFWQLGVTTLTLGYGAPMVWIWAIIEVCTVDKDKHGNQFSS